MCPHPCNDMSLVTCSLTWGRENNLFPTATLDIPRNREETFPCAKQTLLYFTKKRKLSFQLSFTHPQVVPNLYKLIFFSWTQRKIFRTIVGGWRCFTDFIWLCFIIVFVNSIRFSLIRCFCFLCVCIFFKETDFTDEDAAFSEVTLQFITVLLLIHFYPYSKASKVQCSSSIFTQKQLSPAQPILAHHLQKFGSIRFLERN